MKIDRSIFHPDYKREPFWWEAARPGTQYTTDLPSKTEVLIVGSGYSGLSAALELARNELHAFSGAPKPDEVPAEVVAFEPAGGKGRRVRAAH